MLDVWQISADGGYSQFHPGFPEYNLRGRLSADEQRRFEFETVVPQPNEIPTEGATGRLLAALGRSAYRPAHIHLKLSHEGHRPLTTQIHFAGNPWLDRDVVIGATKASLVTRLVSDGQQAANGGSAAPIARCSYDFVLEPVIRAGTSMTPSSEGGPSRAITPDQGDAPGARWMAISTWTACARTASGLTASGLITACSAMPSSMAMRSVAIDAGSTH